MDSSQKTPIDPKLKRVKLFYGPLLDQKDVDSMVMAITDDLTLNSPLNEQILEAGGAQLENEILDHIYKPKPGQTFSFPGFGLPTDYLIVVVKPSLKSTVLLEDKYLLRSYTKAMEHARNLGIQSVAFAAMGTDYLKYPEDRAARLGVAAILQSFYPELSELRIVCKEQKLYKAFYKRLKKMGWSE